MKSLTVTLMSPSDQAIHRLDNLFQDHLKPYLHKAKLEQKKNPTFVDFDVYPDVVTWSRTDRKQIVDALADALSDFIMQEEEETLLRELIVRQYGYDEEEDVSNILVYCRQFLRKELTGSENPKEKSKRELLMTRQIRSVFNEQPLLNLQGFIRFRLREYREELLDVVEYAIDEYLMDKQYQEFISLLKYFVFIQETKIPAAHLMHKGGHEFVLLNDEMKPIDTSQLDSTFTVELLDKEINFEDLIVSTLITVAPQHIYIHTREPEMQVIKTIMQIFEQRAKVCDYCRLCKPVLGERKKQDQLST